MKKETLKSWATAYVTLFVAIAVFCFISEVSSIYFGNFIKNGVAIGLVGVCASIWYYAASKQSPFMMKVVAMVASAITAFVIYGMYFLV